MGLTTNTAIYIEPPSRHFLRDRLFESAGMLNGDNVNAPYAFVRDRLGALGVPVRTADYLPPEPDGAKNLYVSVGMRDRYRRLARRPDVTLSAFFAMECPIVEPELYRELPRAARYFKRIYSWSDNAALERFTGAALPLVPFFWPQHFADVHPDLWGRGDRKFLAMINANKLPCVYYQELYTERLRAVEYFSRSGEIDLYGVGWDGPPFRMGKTYLPATARRFLRAAETQWLRLRPDRLLEGAKRAYRGPARSKSETLANYTFALCFENSILKGWITEKLFDCFFTGTIPVYWGAPEIAEYVPADCFIDRRKFAGYDELRQFLKSLGPAEIRQYKENARAFVRSPRFEIFGQRAFLAIFEKLVREDAGIESAALSALC